MKRSTFILSVVGALLAGYGLGRLGEGAAARGREKGGGIQETGRGGGFFAIAAEDEAQQQPDGSPRLRRPRSEKPAALPDARRVSIPLTSIVPILKKQMFSYRDFTSLAESMETALTMLGATDEERERVQSLVKDTQDRILLEEKKHIKVEKADVDGVALDLSAVDEIAKGIAGELQEGLRGALKPETADALLASVDWDNFYAVQMSGKNLTHRFALERSANGELVATHRYAMGSSSRHLQGPDLPEEGKPTDMSRHFDKRWESYLKGVEMLPVDAPQP